MLSDFSGIIVFGHALKKSLQTEPGGFFLTNH